jgi:hypothetical protein
MKSSSREFLSILHAVPTLHKVINTCLSTSRDFWPAERVSAQEKERKGIVLEWQEGLLVIFFDEAIQI